MIVHTELLKPLLKAKQEKNYKVGINYALEVLQKDFHQLSAHNQALFLCELAQCYLHDGQFDRADHTYEDAIAISDNSFARVGYGQVALKRRDFGAAEIRYAEAVKRFPDNAAAHTGYAQVALKRGDMKAAQKRYENAVEKFPDNEVVLAGYAHTMMRAQAYDVAEQVYAHLVNKFPSNEVAQSGYAQVALERGRYIAAEDRIMKASKLFPNTPQNYTLMFSLADKTRDRIEALKLIEQGIDGLLEKCVPTLKNLNLAYARICKLQGEMHHRKIAKFERAIAIVESSGMLPARELEKFKKHHAKSQQESELPATEISEAEMINRLSSREKNYSRKS